MSCNIRQTGGAFPLFRSSRAPVCGLRPVARRSPVLPRLLRLSAAFAAFPRPSAGRSQFPSGFRSSRNLLPVACGAWRSPAAASRPGTSVNVGRVATLRGRCRFGPSVRRMGRGLGQASFGCQPPLWLCGFCGRLGLGGESWAGRSVGGDASLFAQSAFHRQNSSFAGEVFIPEGLTKCSICLYLPLPGCHFPSER